MNLVRRQFDLLQEEIAPRLERIEDMLAARAEYLQFVQVSADILAMHGSRE